MSNLLKIKLQNFKLQSGKNIPNLFLTYQLFGQPLGNSPVVLVNHALTGNSEVAGENGWWKQLIDFNHIIDLNKYTVIGFNIPGNNFSEENSISQNYKELTTFDVANLFWEGLNYLKINHLYAVIGGSLGGGITWEMAKINVHKISYLIPIATHFFSTDWVIGNVHIQDEILNNSKNPIETARKHAMLLYRTPQSINSRFKNAKESNLFLIEEWLDFHGEKLKSRFDLKAYKQMNYLLKTINISNINDLINQFSGKIHAINVDTDLLFQTDASIYENLSNTYENFNFHQIISPHGHDAFLLEYEQLNNILSTIF